MIEESQPSLVHLVKCFHSLRAVIATHERFTVHYRLFSQAYSEGPGRRIRTDAGDVGLL
jgi:hypothetical protein